MKNSLGFQLHFTLNLTILTKSPTNLNMFWISKILSDDAGNMSYAKTIVSIAASLAASAMVFRSITRDLIPYELQKYIHSSIHDFFTKYFSLQVTLIIEQSSGLSSNQIYKAAKVYLGTKISPHTNKFMVTMPRMETTVSTSMAKNQELFDHYNGASLKWKHISRHVESTRSTPLSSNPGQVEASYLELRFHKKHKNMVMEQYFPYILSESKAIKEERKTLRIHTLKPDSQMRRFAGLCKIIHVVFNITRKRKIKRVLISMILTKLYCIHSSMVLIF